MCLYPSNLWKTVSIKRTKYSRKSQVQNYYQNIHYLYEHMHLTTTVCTPDSVRDRQQCQCCHHDVQFTVCHILTFTQSNQICHSFWLDGLNHVIPVFVRKFTQKYYSSCNVFFTQNFNEMFIFVGERHDFTDVKIMPSGKGCTSTWHVKL